MKSLVREYLDVVMYTICGILIILSSYNILINFNHAKYLDDYVVVSDNDNNYRVYKENVLKLESKLNQISSNNREYYVLKSSLSLMKSGGAYTLMPGSSLTYYDLYSLNNYFVDTLVNNGWTSMLKQVDYFNTSINNSFINILVNNSEYVNKELLNNSNYHYDAKNSDIRKTIDEEYNAILNNYKNYSALVLELYNNVGGKNA